VLPRLNQTLCQGQNKFVVENATEVLKKEHFLNSKTSQSFTFFCFLTQKKKKSCVVHENKLK